MWVKENELACDFIWNTDKTELISFIKQYCEVDDLESYFGVSFDEDEPEEDEDDQDEEEIEEDKDDEMGTDGRNIYEVYGYGDPMAIIPVCCEEPYLNPYWGDMLWLRKSDIDYWWEEDHNVYER